MVVENLVYKHLSTCFSIVGIATAAANPTPSPAPSGTLLLLESLLSPPGPSTIEPSGFLYTLDITPTMITQRHQASQSRCFVLGKAGR